MPGVCDSFHRGISYLRISVTDRCNLRCIYCMPEEGMPLVLHRDILHFEEILPIVCACVELGIDKIRITGGEPLVRSGIVDLIRMITAIEGIRDISMTTNGILLAEHARGLKEAGLHRVNISLDTLKIERYRKITRVGALDDVLRGIEAAVSAGLSPVKINIVPMRGINDDEIIDFARMTRDKNWHVRFIELMPFNQAAEFVPSSEVRTKIETLGPLEPDTKMTGNGPARYYRLPQASGTIGFISPMTEPFCQKCNRLRLSSTGMLYACLFSEQGFDLRTPLREGSNIEEIKKLVTKAIETKPKEHCFNGSIENKRMYGMGG
ncbi:MAG: GTP 3',8-cyclase MoaA [Dehalococcoidia bacterium]|nr:GTP 3',8-cyclase MoaA [Dehalococcoidia bacterium]